ncbi:polysaccharide pyruvyl transferase family protein [Rhodococcus sp. BP-241]|uniref:polysaccharide pyruvyl transferase family protein n=1 Tax=Rhodococcus sp. BP-241 TaxID=2739441 RepID=UPI001C9BB8C4|nr:polysaccharide pyruvyl transferase family protein [Rhodococcus sp. BP-241]MBY6709506.1 polysaccharide pyruvyl transferase family protein [Rhodococcus sp. BP-241]
MELPWVDDIQTATLSALETVIPRGSRAALIDFPSHQNAGDTLIYLGEMEYFAQMGVSIDYVCDFTRYRADLVRKFVPEGPILLHGGGNFGDAWDHFEILRHRVISDFPDRQIVFLPQSIWYNSPAKLEQSKRILGSHKNLTILAREQRSLAFAHDEFGDSNRVVHCPDTAFGIGLQPKPSPDFRFEIVQLLRQDRERVERPALNMTQPSVTLDWGLSGRDSAAWRVARLPGRISSTVPRIAAGIDPALKLGYRVQAALNFRAALKTLSLGRVVLTDRLHAAVLGALMGSPVVALDNNYGKIHDVYTDYLKSCRGVHYVTTTEQAQEQVEELLG